MASSYTSRLRLEKQADGENSATWGQKANMVFDLIDDAVSGMTTVATTGGTTTLTANNGAADQSRMAIIKVTGALVSNAILQIPSQTKKYVVWNATSGAFTVTVKTSSGAAIAIAQGKRLSIICDGTDCYSANTDYAGMGLATASQYNVGTSAFNVVALDSFGRLPAVDGSQLTGIGSSGEANTASNQGAGYGLFKLKSGVDLQFYSINLVTASPPAANSPASLTLGMVGDVLTFTFTPAGGAAPGE